MTTLKNAVNAFISLKTCPEGFHQAVVSHTPNAAISANVTTVITATKKRIFMINPSVPFSNKQININKKERERKKEK